MRIGLLGTGPWADIAYGPALRDHPDVEFAGVWGRRPEAAKAVADKFGTTPYSDVDALIEDVDAIAVALPPAVQAGYAARAARAGRHLLLDKPLAATVPDGRAVVDAVDEAGVSSIVFFTSRFTREIQEWLPRQVESGGWFTAHAVWLGALDSGWSPFAESPWRREMGGLWDVGPHALSILIPVLGDVREVASATRGPEDTVHLVCRHEGGASSTITAALLAPGKAAGTGVELRGAAGVVRLPEQREDGPVALARAIDALIESARTGQAHPCDVNVRAACRRDHRRGSTAAGGLTTRGNHYVT